MIVTSAVDAAHGGLEILHLNTIGPVPLVWVNVAFGALAFGLKLPVPPLTIAHWPKPTEGVLPPRLAVVPPVQMVWLPPVVAVVGLAV